MHQGTGLRRLPPRLKQRGFVLVVSAIASVILLGCLGMAVDLGRLYLVKSESQNFVDSVALEAAVNLDGTLAGIQRAASVAAQSSQRFDMASKAFTGTTTRFATTLDGPWYEFTGAPLKSRFVRVVSNVSVPMYFMTLVTAKRNGTVAASGTAAQVEKTTFTEGIFPFSPFAHSKVGPHYGLIRGEDYTLRWAANPKLNVAMTTCKGDRDQPTIDIANASGGSERGFIEETSASAIRDTIINDFQTVTRTVGDLVDLTGGAKQTMLDALQERINQDTNNYAATYNQYTNSGTGNGRRLVGVPINDGGTPPGVNHRIVSIGLFFLKQTGEYGNGGGQPWCAEYVGSYVEGSNNTGVEESGAWVVRLVR